MRVNENILTTIYNQGDQNAVYIPKLPGALSQDHSASGEMRIIEMGEDIDFGQICFLHTDGKYYKADADNSAERAELLLAVDDFRANTTGIGLVDGYARDDSWSFTTQDDLYLSNTDGGITATAPSDGVDNVEHIGMALTPTIIRFRHNNSENKFKDITVYGDSNINGLAVEDDTLQITYGSNLFYMSDISLNIGSADNWGFQSSQSTLILQAEELVTIGDKEGVNNEAYIEINSVDDTITLNAANTTISGNCTADKYVSAITTITTGGDDKDVSGCSVLKCDSSIANITIGGFTGGVTGQILHLFNSAGNNIILEDDEGTGNQDIKTHTGADVTITAEGGATLVYDGTVWRIIGIAQ